HLGTGAEPSCQGVRAEVVDRLTDAAVRPVGGNVVAHPLQERPEPGLVAGFLLDFPNRGDRWCLTGIEFPFRQRPVVMMWSMYEGYQRLAGCVVLPQHGTSRTDTRLVGGVHALAPCFACGSIRPVVSRS